MCHKSGNGANARTNRLICPSVRGSQLTLLPSADFNQVVKQASAQPAPECKWQRLRKKLCWRPARRKIDLAASLWKVCLCFIIHLCYQRPFRQLFVIEWKPHLSSRIISSCHLLLLSMFPSLPPSQPFLFFVIAANSIASNTDASFDCFSSQHPTGLAYVRGKKNCIIYSWFIYLLIESSEYLIKRVETLVLNVSAIHPAIARSASMSSLALLKQTINHWAAS